MKINWNIIFQLSLVAAMVIMSVSGVDGWGFVCFLLFLTLI